MNSARQPPSFWDQRYAADDYFYGEEPNTFLTTQAPLIPPGPVLCLAEGEGRNAVFLAGRGHAVTAVDGSAAGLAKAERLAARRSVTLTTVVADLAAFAVTPNHWSAIVAIFAHLPPPLRRATFAAAVAGLRPGGVFLLEAYTPAQLAFGTGGPKDPTLLMSLSDPRTELSGLTLELGQEIERDVIEGHGHTGRAAVVQVVGRKPV
jgi:SAM-dependent methyltransferase